MCDISALLESEVQQERLAASEFARGHPFVLERLDTLLTLGSRVGLLRRKIREHHSFAKKAASNKTDREAYTALAARFGDELTQCEERLKDVAGSFGNILLQTGSESHRWNSIDAWRAMLSNFGPIGRFYSEVPSHHSGSSPTASSYIQEIPCDYLDASNNLVITKLPCIVRGDPTSTPFGDPFRFVYDSNHLLDADAMTICEKWLPDYKFVAQITPRGLFLQAEHGFEYYNNEGVPVGAIYLEGGFMMRQMNFRIPKQVRMKLSSNPYPSSILMIRYRLAFGFFQRFANKDCGDLDHLTKAISESNFADFCETAEDMLRLSSFLSDDRSLDRLAYAFTLRNDGYGTLDDRYPCVQYPHFHRWLRHMKCQTREFES